MNKSNGNSAMSPLPELLTETQVLDNLQRLHQHSSILAALWRRSELHQNGQAGAVSCG